MNKDDFIKMYKDTKKEKIIEELFYKCNANYKLNNIIDELEKYLKNRIDELQEQEKIYQLNNRVPIYELFTLLGTIIRLKEQKEVIKSE